MEAAHTSWRPLGRLLVAKGLLSEDQLDDALRDQALSGCRLGEILVESGYVSQRALSLALAEQYGIEPPTETGFGTGLLAALEHRQRSGDARKPEADPEESNPHLVLAAVPAEAPPGPVQAAAIDRLPLAGMEEQWARLAAAEEQLAHAERELAAVTRRHERRRRQAARLLERRRRQRERGSAAPQALESEAAAGTGSADGHLVLAQVGRRYVLLERDGRCPDPGAVLELPALPETGFVVVGRGRAALPGDPRQCVLAQQVGRRAVGAHDDP